MGFTYIKVKVYNPADMSRSGGARVLVDSGAIFTSIPKKRLTALGLKPLESRTLRVYAGGRVKREIGVVVVEYGNRKAGVPVIFGQSGDTTVLGDTALDSLGYLVDPTTRKLKPTELLMI